MTLERTSLTNAADTRELPPTQTQPSALDGKSQSLFLFAFQWFCHPRFVSKSPCCLSKIGQLLFFFSTRKLNFFQLESKRTVPRGQINQVSNCAARKLLLSSATPITLTEEYPTPPSYFSHLSRDDTEDLPCSEGISFKVRRNYSSSFFSRPCVQLSVSDGHSS